MSRRILLATGGSGGHFFPAIAVAEACVAAGDSVMIASDKFWGDIHEEIELVKIRAVTPFTKSLHKIPMSLLLSFTGMMKVLFKIRKWKPDVVIAWGSYACIPTSVAAILYRVPLIVHQSDINLGKAQRFLSKWAKYIAVGCKEDITASLHPKHRDKVIYTGIPLRSKFVPTPYDRRAKGDNLHILITGGSGGAKVWNEVFPKAISHLSVIEQSKLVIHQQCSAKDHATVMNIYKYVTSRVELHGFVSDMAAELKWCHIAFGRAGMLTIAETATIGRPLFMVPYPHGGQHQYANAEYVESNGGGWYCDEGEINEKHMAEFLRFCLNHPDAIAEKALNIGKIANNNPTEEIFELINRVSSN